MNKIRSFMIITAGILAGTVSLYGADKNKTIVYVKDFIIEEGLKINDPIKTRVKEIIQEEFEKNGKYTITADEDISAIMQQQEKAQSFGKCSSDSCVQKLMEKINANIIIFGRIRKIDNFIYITVRYMDRSTGAPRVSKIRTIKYRHDEFFEKGVKALAEYLLTDDDDEVKDFMDEVYTREEESIQKQNASEANALRKRKQELYRKKVEQAAEDRKKGIVSRSPVFRFGYGFYMSAADKEMNDAFPEQSGFIFDLLFARNSLIGSVNDPFKYDFFLRFSYRTYEMNDSSIKTGGTPGQDVVNDSDASFYGLDLGFRIKTMKYFMLTAFEPYFLAAFRSGIYKEKAKDKYDGSELEITLIGYGGYIGGGIEFAFFENMGFFCEYNRGILKLGDGKINIDGDQVYGGITYRTDFSM